MDKGPMYRTNITNEWDGLFYRKMVPGCLDLAGERKYALW